jgi:nitrile hydratase accessory protein
MAVRVSAQRRLTWADWAATLADELKSAVDRGEPDDGSHQYEHWLAALERLVIAKALLNPGEMLDRKEARADAYRHTPHRKPVTLQNASHDHDHD